METSKNLLYSSELKESAVMDYLAGAGSYRDICIKYGIKSNSQVRDWISKYNGHEKLKSSGTGGVPIVTKIAKQVTGKEAAIVQ